MDNLNFKSCDGAAIIAKPNIDGYIYSVGELNDTGIITIEMVTTDLELAVSTFISGECNCKNKCRVIYIWKDNISIIQTSTDHAYLLTWVGIYDETKTIAQHVFSDMGYLDNQINKYISNDYRDLKSEIHFKLVDKVGTYYNNKYRESHLMI